MDVEYLDAYCISILMRKDWSDLRILKLSSQFINQENCKLDNAGIKGLLN